MEGKRPGFLTEVHFCAQVEAQQRTYPTRGRFRQRNRDSMHFAGQLTPEESQILMGDWCGSATTVNRR